MEKSWSLWLRCNALSGSGLPTAPLQLGPRKPENRWSYDQLLGISGGLSLWQPRGAHFWGPEELLMAFSSSCFPARKSLNIYTFWRTSSKGMDLTPTSHCCWTGEMKGYGYITVASGAVYLQQDSVLENTRVLTGRKHTRREKGEWKRGHTLKPRYSLQTDSATA